MFEEIANVSVSSEYKPPLVGHVSQHIDYTVRP